MFSQKQTKTVKEPFTADELRNHIYNMNAFLSPVTQKRLTLDALPDGSNHLMVAAAYRRDNDSIASVIRLLMPIIPSLKFLREVVAEEKSDFNGWTIATCAAETDTQALQTIFACLPKIVVKESLEEEQQSLARFTLSSGPFTGYSMVHFAAMGGSRRNLELLDLHGAELYAELSAACKDENGKSRAKWTPLDLAIQKWIFTKGKSEKNVFTDVINYFLAYVREKKKDLKLSTLIENIQSKHGPYLTKEKLKNEVIPLIQTGYRNATYVQLSATTVTTAFARSTSHKRKTEAQNEVKLSVKTKKLKPASPATKSLSSSATMTFSLEQDMELKSPKEKKLSEPTFTFVSASQNQQLVADQKQKIEKLETENAALKKELKDTVAKLHAALTASVEKDKKLEEEHKQTEKLEFALHQSQCAFKYSKSQHLDAERENLELRLKLNDKEKELMTRENEISYINRVFPEVAERRLAGTTLPDDERDENMSSLLMPVSPRN